MTREVVQGHKEREHALLSASSAKTWLSCTPSARLSEEFPDTESEFASEGTLAHEIAELKLRKAFVEPIGPKAYKTKFNKLMARLDEHPTWERTVDKYTDVYLDYISGIVHSFNSPPYVAIEKRLDYSAYAPEGFGTGDCIVISGQTLYINDLKYGKGVPVYAAENPQMMLYALGALAAYSFLYPIQTVKLAIIQPRLDNISEWEISVQDLRAWGDSIKPTAEKAFKGEGEFVAGEHCRLCRVRFQCRARAEYHLELEGFHKMRPPLISDAEVAQILERAETLAKWASDLKEYALKACLAGKDIPGYKAVHGKGSRQYRDIDAAFTFLTENGIEEAMLYKREPLSVKGVEDLLGKKKFNELLFDHIENKPGKPTIVPESDKREAISQPNAMDDFSQTSDE